MVQEMNQQDKTSSSYPQKKMDERYQTLFEQVNAAAFLTSFHGQIYEANHKSCELSGYLWDELMHLSLKDLFKEGFDWQQFQEEIAARGGTHLETEIMKKDGDFVPVDFSTSLFRMDKKPMMFVLIWDITERKLTEKKIRENEKKYRGLFEYTTDGIIVLDARGDILDVNTKMCQIFDFTKDELVGKNLLSMELLTPNSLPVVVGQFQQLLSEKTAKNYTTEIKTRRGDVFTVEISSFFLVKKNNEVDNFVLSIRNITERIHSEQRRMIEHQLFQTLLKTIPDSVYFKDNHHRFILVNPAKAKHCNTNASEMVGQTDFEYYSKEIAESIHEDEKRIMRTGEPLVNKVKKIKRPDGTFHWISETKVPWFDQEGDIIGIMGVSRDVSDLHVDEDEFSKQKDVFLTLINSLSDSIYFKDTENKYVLVNNKKASFFNVLPEKIIGKTDNKFHPYLRDEELPDYDSKVLDTCEGIYNKMKSIELSDGSVQWYSVTKVPVLNKDNECIGVLSISRNITELKPLESKKVNKHK